ncbi:MAG: tRNA(His) guanylyltransferase Thg1 family protein [bacterium]
MSLSDRMKQYESVTDIEMTHRMPVIIRVDGRAFHYFTQGLDTFDEQLTQAMSNTAKELCKDIQGSAFAFVQSDEISVLTTPYTSLDFEPYFGNRVQKITSVSASIATRAFNNEWDGEEMAEFDTRAFALPPCFGGYRARHSG